MNKYYLKQKFSVKMQYDSNSYLKFALYELKAEYDNCQQQIGWSDGNKNIITWDIAGNLVINSEFGLDPNVDNIADLYAVWTTNTYGLDVDYQSELMDNIYGREIVVPTNFANLNVNLEPVKTGYNLDYFTMQIDKTNSGVYSYVLDNGNNKLTKEFLENFKITRSVKLQAYWTTSNTETNFSIVVEIVTDYGNSKNEYYITGFKSGSPKTYGTGERDRDRFRKDYVHIWRAYMKKQVVFEAYIYEIIFDKYYNIK